jgi:uncharacterized integral membrane protein
MFKKVTTFALTVFTLSALFLPLLIVAALAQDANTTTTTRVIDAGSIYDTAVPYVLTALSAVVSGILAWLAALFQRWTGIRIEAEHREALHSAAMSGVAAALTKFRVSAEKVRFEVSSPVVADAVEWMLKSVPDAIRALGATPENLRALVLSKISILAETPSSSSTGNPGVI